MKQVFMMKTLIAYAGNNGTTEKCAKLLAEKINGADVVNLAEKTPDLKAYDTVAVGSNIHAGQIHKAVKKFLANYGSVLKQKRSAYFICCGFPDNQKQVFAANFPKELLDSAVAKECFGGELNIDSLHGLDKLIAKMVTKATAGKNIAPPSIRQDSIDEMAALLNK